MPLKCENSAKGPFKTHYLYEACQERNLHSLQKNTKNGTKITKKCIYTQEAITTFLHNFQVDSNTCNTRLIFVVSSSTYQHHGRWHAIETAFHPVT